MNNPVGLLQAIQDTSTEPAKFQLNASHSEHSAPYIDHWVVQLHGVSPERIDDPDALTANLRHAVAKLNLTRVSDHTHYFGPGVSSVIILSESHLSAHTWPELGYVHLDIVTCVERLTGESLREVMQSIFDPARMQLAQIEY